MLSSDEFRFFFIVFLSAGLISVVVGAPLIDRKLVVLVLLDGFRNVASDQFDDKYFLVV
jgi:hypothetical protein